MSNDCLLSHSNLCSSRARIPQLPDDILGLIFEHFVQPVPKPNLNSQIHSGAVLGDSRLSKTLRSLCLVSKRFDGQARPRLYRHIGVPNNSFLDTSNASDSQAKRFITLDLLCHTLVESPGTLPSMVRTLHVWPEADNVHHVLSVLNLCKGLHMVSFHFPETIPSVPWQPELLANVCAHLEYLDEIKLLSWDLPEQGTHLHVLLAPLLSISLPHLESLNIISLSLQPDLRQLAGLANLRSRAALPSLRFLEVLYSQWEDRDSSDAGSFVTREEVVHCLRGILGTLLDKSPGIASLRFTSNLLGDQISYAIPPSISSKLQRLHIRGLQRSASGSAYIDVRPLAVMSQLSRLTADNAIPEQGWYSLPNSLTKLSLKFESTQLLSHFTSFLNHTSNLPILRELHVEFVLRWLEYSVDPVHVEELNEEWEKLLKVAHKRGILAMLDSEVHYPA